MYNHRHQVSLSLSIYIYIYIRPCNPSLPVDLLDDILCPYEAVVGKFLLVGQNWLLHVKGSIGERYL